MSKFIDVEWFGRGHKIGIVLTYDEHDGFKVRMSPVQAGVQLQSEENNIKWIMENAAKIPFEWAWAIWGSRMKTEWIHEHLADGDYSIVRYDSRNYDVKTLQEVES